MINRLIVGSGRSGTTWIQDALAEANGLRPVFEPLLLLETDNRGASYCPALTSSRDESRYRELWKDAFSGALQSVWTDLRIRPSRLRPDLQALSGREAIARYAGRWLTLARRWSAYRALADRRETLVKSIRASLMLDWVKAQFNADIALIVRHPAAVVESQLRRADGDWDPYPAVEYYAGHQHLLADLGDGFRDLANRKLDKYAAATFRWCVENAAALRSVDSGSATLFFYEDLSRQDPQAWSRLAATLKLESLPATAELSRPSQQASAEFRTASDNPSAGSAWQSRLDENAMASIDYVLRATGMKLYDLDREAPVGAPAGAGLRAASTS